MPASQSAVHSGVRIDTNGSSADGKGTSSKQVSGFDAFKSESMVRGNVQRYSIAGSAVLTSVNSLAIHRCEGGLSCAMCVCRAGVHESV